MVLCRFNAGGLSEEQKQEIKEAQAEMERLMSEDVPERQRLQDEESAFSTS